MAKRFTDTDKWKDNWFKKLPGKIQFFWLYVLDTCDHAGIWPEQLSEFTYHTGFKVTPADIEKHLSDRLVLVKDETYLAVKFIPFQYPNFNPQGNKAHIGVVNALRRVGLDYPFEGSLKPLRRSLQGVQEKEQEQVLVKELEKVNSSREESLAQDAVTLSFTPDRVVNLWNAVLGAQNGFVTSLGAGKHLMACIDSIGFLKTESEWRGLFEKTAQSKFLMGENPRGWKVPLVWLVNYDNALRVLSDEFNNANASTEDLFAGIREVAS